MGKFSKYDNNRNGKVQDDWLIKFPWLKYRMGKPFCTYCKIEMTNKIYNLNKHVTTTKHKNNTPGAQLDDGQQSIKVSVM